MSTYVSAIMKEANFRRTGAAKSNLFTTMLLAVLPPRQNYDIYEKGISIDMIIYRSNKKLLGKQN